MATSYIKRFLICIFSLAVFSLGNICSVLAGSAGTNAWGTLAIGLSGASGISFGTATLMISIAIVTIDILLKGKIGFGTLLNAALIPFFSDLYLRFLTFTASTQFTGAIISLTGQIILSFAGIAYMSPNLGAGPRDTLMIVVGKRFPKAPIGLVKFGLEISALLTGVLLGAPFGLGTVLSIALQSTIFQFACRICRYEPRNAAHEDVIYTLRRMFSSKETP